MAFVFFKEGDEMNISGFYSDSISNGEGWRAVLFVSGCPHFCKGCHNIKTWSADFGDPYNEEVIYQKIIDNRFLDGITLSGGEPFLYYKELLPLLKRLKRIEINIWSYTGYTFEDLLLKAKTDHVLNEFLHHIDVLVDGPFILEKKSFGLKFRGSSNQRIIDVPKSLKGHRIVHYYDHEGDE